MPTTFNYMHRTMPLHQLPSGNCQTTYRLPDDLQTVLGKSGDGWRYAYAC